MGLRKTTNTVPHGSSFNGTVVRPSTILNETGSRLACLRVPQFGRLARHPERGIHRCGAVATVVNEVDVPVAQLSVNKL